MNFDEFALYIEGGSGKVLVPKASVAPQGILKGELTVFVTTGCCGSMVKFPLHFVVAGCANPSVRKVTSKVERFKNTKDVSVQRNAWADSEANGGLLAECAM